MWTDAFGGGSWSNSTGWVKPDACFDDGDVLDEEVEEEDIDDNNEPDGDDPREHNNFDNSYLV